jgi:alkyl hydroperoxide reductase subunit AhpF
MPETEHSNPFDAETWAILPKYLAKLPNRILLRVWGDPGASAREKEAARLAEGLADRFGQLEMALLPRRVNYPYYPVLGVFGLDKDEAVDYGVRLIGLPAGVQMTSLIAAIQAVSFAGGTLEAKTRIQLSKLQDDVTLELLSSAEDEAGTTMAKALFGLAVASTHVRSFLIMADVFPEALWRYSVSYLPHLVVNGRVHADGQLNEEMILRQIALALR